MSSIAPLMTRLTELYKVYAASYNKPPKFIVTNQFTARQLINEAHIVKKIENRGSTLAVDGLLLVIHPQDHTDKTIMEVA